MENSINERLKSFIEGLRDEKGKEFSPRKFALMTNQKPSAIYLILSGKGLPSVGMLMDIKKAFPEFDLNYFITGRFNTEAMSEQVEDAFSKAEKDLKEKESRIKELEKDLLNASRNVIFLTNIIEKRASDEDKELIKKLNFNGRVVRHPNSHPQSYLHISRHSGGKTDSAA